MIDIGCGVLGILSQLRSRVGDGGRVVRLDIEPRLPAGSFERMALLADAPAWRGHR